jgi:hypothetical protein
VSFRPACVGMIERFKKVCQFTLSLPQCDQGLVSL